MAALAVAVTVTASPAMARTLTACPAEATAAGCDFKGNLAIQAAVDRAADGDTILIKAGTYAAEKLRDVAFSDRNSPSEYLIRAFIVVERKSLRLIGEPGVIIDGDKLPSASALLVKGGDVRIRNLTIRNFRYAHEDDDIWDGYGIFIWDASAEISNVTLERFRKFGLSARGTSNVVASNMRIVDGHVAVWARESAQLQLCNSLVRNNDAAGVGAAGSGSLRIYNSVVEGSQHSGLYFREEAVGYATNSIIVGNKPYGIDTADDAQVWVNHSVVSGNEKGTSVTTGSSKLRLVPGVREFDPKLDGNSRMSAAVAAGIKPNPEVRDPRGALTEVGLHDVAACLSPQ